MFRKPHILLALSIPLVAFLHYGEDFHGSRTFIGLLLVSVALGAVVWRRVHWSAGLTFGWTLISGVLVFGAPESPFTPMVGLDHALPEHMPIELQFRVSEARRALAYLDTGAAVAFASVIAYTLPLLFTDTKVRRALLSGFGWICITDSIYVLAQLSAGNGYFESGGFFGNYSMNASVIAFTYPIWLHTRRPIKRWKRCAIGSIGNLLAVGTPVMAVIFSHSNMAVLSLTAAMASVAFMDIYHHGWKKDYLAYLASIACTPFLGGIVMGHDKFGHDSGRFAVWRGLVAWWGAHANHWTGTGLGTLFFLGPHIQVADLHQTTDGFFWAHNDPLTIGFEMGLIGVATVAIMLVCAAYSSVKLKRPWLLSSLAAYVVASLGTYPTHLPVTGFFGAFLIVLAFDPPSSPLYWGDEVLKCRSS